MSCSVKECSKEAKVKGLCRYHYFLGYINSKGETHRNIMKQRSRDVYNADKVVLFDLLGRKCSNSECLVVDGCADIRCLQFDHVFNDGYEDRKRFKSCNAMYRYYATHPEEAKKRLQVLCANCNWVKKHETRKHKNIGGRPRN